MIYIFLADNIEHAEIVGKRRTDHPVILRIDAKHANKAGILFYYGNADVILSDTIPAEFIEVEDISD